MVENVAMLSAQKHALCRKYFLTKKVIKERRRRKFVISHVFLPVQLFVSFSMKKFSIAICERSFLWGCGGGMTGQKRQNI
jgi:hypothetical protein